MALTRCMTTLSRLRGGTARGPFTDEARSRFVVCATDDGEAIDTDRVNSVPLCATRSTTLCLVVEIVRRGASVGGAGMGIVGGGRTVGDRAPTGRGEGGRLIRKTDPDLNRVDRGGVVVRAGAFFKAPVPLGVERSTPLGNTAR